MDSTVPYRVRTAFPLLYGGAVHEEGLREVFRHENGALSEDVRSEALKVAYAMFHLQTVSANVMRNNESVIKAIAVAIAAALRLCKALTMRQRERMVPCLPAA